MAKEKKGKLAGFNEGKEERKDKDGKGVGILERNGKERELKE